METIETDAATEVVITRNGRPVARLTGLQVPARPRRRRPAKRPPRMHPFPKCSADTRFPSNL